MQLSTRSLLGWQTNQSPMKHADLSLSKQRDIKCCSAGIKNFLPSIYSASCLAEVPIIYKNTGIVGKLPLNNSSCREQQQADMSLLSLRNACRQARSIYQDGVGSALQIYSRSRSLQVRTVHYDQDSQIYLSYTQRDDTTTHLKKEWVDNPNRCMQFT